jgi:hypothetical protein
MWLDFSKDAATMAQQVVNDECPAPIFADWIQEHPECWRKGDGVQQASEVICEWLRSIR